MYDVIVVGARVAGSPAAMLLAQKGYRVLLVDRVRFPSDTLSTHQVQIPGGVKLKRWGLLDEVLSSNCPPARRASFNVVGSLRFAGDYPALEGVNGVISPRRRVLDKILVDAAVRAGVELRENFLVEELTFDGERVTGLRGRSKSGKGARVSETARLVVGADGKRSKVAQAVRAPEYRQIPALTCAYYTYWHGLDLDGGEMYSLPKQAVGIWPTNDGLAMIYTAYPVGEFPAVKADVEGRFWRTMEHLPGVAERLRAGQQAERFYGTADLPAFYRRPYGPGWALVGDAGMTMDPITGRGIGHAFQDAERLAYAVDAFRSGGESFNSAMQQFESERNAATLPIYEFTAELASFSPPSIEQQMLFAVLAKKPEVARQFFGVLSGSVSMQKFFSPGNLIRIIGPVGMGRVAWSKMIAARQPSLAQPNL